MEVLFFVIVGFDVVLGQVSHPGLNSGRKTLHNVRILGDEGFLFASVIQVT